MVSNTDINPQTSRLIVSTGLGAGSVKKAFPTTDARDEPTDQPAWPSPQYAGGRGRSDVVETILPPTPRLLPPPFA